jgi:hypothetical protein
VKQLRQSVAGEESHAGPQEDVGRVVAVGGNPQGARGGGRSERDGARHHVRRAAAVDRRMSAHEAHVELSVVTATSAVVRVLLAAAVDRPHPTELLRAHRDGARERVALEIHRQHLACHVPRAVHAGRHDARVERHRQHREPVVEVIAHLRRRVPRLSRAEYERVANDVVEQDAALPVALRRRVEEQSRCDLEREPARERDLCLSKARPGWIPRDLRLHRPHRCRRKQESEGETRGNQRPSSQSKRSTPAHRALRSAVTTAKDSSERSIPTRRNPRSAPRSYRWARRGNSAAPLSSVTTR